MKALLHAGQVGVEGLLFGETANKKPGAGEVRVKLKTAGLNHRDLFSLTKHQPTEPPLILGSDGAGVIDLIGVGVTGVTIGDEVMINPGIGWTEKSDAPPEDFEILGLPNDGTFAEQVIVPAENVVSKPEHLSWEEAGVLSLAALTAYRALFTRGKVQSGMKVFIPGIGGGVATFLLQFATAAGADVYVTSRSQAKREAAVKLGATAAIDSAAAWNEALNGMKMDLVIESVGAATFNQSLKQLRRGGTIVTFGSSTGDQLDFNLREFFYGQYNLLGSTMGSSEEYVEMLEFVKKHQIKPVLDKMYRLQEFADAFTRLEAAKQLGKIGFYTEN